MGGREVGEEVEDVWDYDCVARGVLGSLVELWLRRWLWRATAFELYV